MKLDELHDRLFECLCTVDDICRENHLTYFLDGGTELGSVREKDFIAWDDDADIKIRAEELPEFLRVMREKLPDYMKIVEPRDFAPYYYDQVFRILDMRYPLHEETEEDRCYRNFTNRVGVDVFLMAKTPAGALSSRIYDFRNRMLYGYGIAHRYGKKSEAGSFIEKAEVTVLSFIGKRFTAEKLCEKWLKHVNKYDKSQRFFRYPADFAMDELHFIPAAVYEGVAYGEIRGRKFPVPAGVDEDLTLTFGDWRTPRKDFKENGKPFERHTEE